MSFSICYRMYLIRFNRVITHRIGLGLRSIEHSIRVRPMVRCEPLCGGERGEG